MASSRYAEPDLIFILSFRCVLFCNRVWLLHVLAFVTSCSAAQAGAFNEPAGHAQIILTSTRSSANQYWLADGATRLPVSYALHEQSMLMQFGLTSQLMGILKLSRVSASGTAGATYDSTGPIELGRSGS